MKIGYAAALALLISTPALSANTRTDNGVTFTCEVTGSDKDGFSLYAKNDGKSDKSCTASCKLTKSDKSSQEWDYGSRTVRAQTDPSVRSGPPRMYFGGEAGLKGKPLSNPDVTKASCK